MIRFWIFISLLIQSASAQNSSEAPPPSAPWQTLNGQQPLVIARGGFSGLFPESSQYANQVALQNSLNTTVLYCNLQLSKDGIGFCLSGVTIQNSTNSQAIFPEGEETYNVNGQDVKGWFSMDFTSDQLFNLSVVQPALSRSSLFDNTQPLSTVDEVINVDKFRPSKLWLNVQYDMFYNQHKLSPASFIQKSVRLNPIQFISSPEINFLKALNGKVDKRTTKLVFRFEAQNEMEPTTRQAYGSLLKNLSSIKAFASGILVPKEYIWPVDKDKYLEDATSLVTDAHREGLEVYAYGFANDIPSSFNYSYEPEAEYLKFIDNSKFSVDGMLTDFPPTASAAIGCLAHNENGSRAGKNLLVISENGASGVYAVSTDLAYDQAVEDGADIIDCSVQMSKDGVAFCFKSVNLATDTTAMTTFMDRYGANIVASSPGIFSFDLTWTEIQSLKPQLASSLPANSSLPRNPANKNKGKFMTLESFLEFAKRKAVPGILINIENAPYLASEKGLSITDVVASALSNATFDKQAKQQVLILSDDSKVLSKFKDVPSYKRVLNIKKVVGDAPQKPVEEIKKIADAVAVTRSSIIQTTMDSFTKGSTSIVAEMHAANISVYVGVLKNEFTTIPLDLFSDPMVELATYWMGNQVDGVITEYPRTASSFLRSSCSNDDENGYRVSPAKPGALLQLAPPEALSPAAAPKPPLGMDDIVDPPLPPLSNGSTPQIAPSPVETRSDSPPPRLVNGGLSVAAIAVVFLLSLGTGH